MHSDRGHHGVNITRLRLLFACGLAAALAAVTVARAAAPTPATVAAEADRLGSATSVSAKLARRLAPEAGGLAHALPGVLGRLDSLREPTATTEEQLRVALGQMQQMSALAYDPHYLPALLAVGRAYLAATGSDPLSGTAVDPEYTGLGRELSRAGSDLKRGAARATRLSHEVKSLSRELARQKRRAARLAGALQRLSTRAQRSRS
jgi:hypothetical protein